MNMMSALQLSKIDPVAALIDGLTHGLDAADAAFIARYFIDSELADFCWEAREREVWIGEYQGFEDEAGTLDRVAILSRLDGRFHVGIALVDGDECIRDLRQHRSFTSAWDAEEAFERLRS